MRYEYRCKGCQSEIEVEQRISEDPLKKCPTCKKNKLERLISKSSFILRGSNWEKRVDIDEQE